MATSIQTTSLVTPSSTSTAAAASSTEADSAVEPSNPLQNIATLVSKGQIDFAIQSANGISNELLQSYALLNLTRILCSTGDFDRATTVADSIPYPKERSEALHSISIALTTNEKIDQALEIASRMPSPAVSSLAHRDIAEGLLLTKDTKKAHEVFHRAVWAYRGIPAEKLSNFSSLVIDLRKTLGNIGKIFVERHALDQLREIEPERNALNGIKMDIDDMVLQEGYDYALWDSIKKFIALGRLDKALELTVFVVGSIKCKVFQEVSKALLVSGDTEEAIKIALMIRREDIVFETAKLISDVLLTCNNVERAITLALALPEDIYHPRTKTKLLSKIILDCAKAGEFAQALAFLDRFPDTHHSTYNKVLGKWAVAGHLDEAMKRLERRNEQHKNIHGKAQIAGAFAKAGKLDLAEIMLGFLDAKEYSTFKKARYYIARAQLNSGEPTKALKTIAGSDYEHRIRTERALLLITESKIDEALDIVRETPKKESDYYCSDLKKDVSIALAKAGEYEHANTLAKTILRKEKRDLTLQEIAILLAQNGSIDRAKQVANSIKTISFKAFALFIIGLTPSPVNTAQETT